MSASTEFVTLCQAQVRLMTQSLAADSTAIYLAENWADYSLPELVPIAAYPPRGNGQASDWLGLSGSGLLLQSARHDGAPEVEIATLDAASEASESDSQPITVPPVGDRSRLETDALPAPAGVGQRAVLPLVHEGVVMGVLVSMRGDRPWQASEYTKLEQFAQALSLACVLDQRGQWLQNRLQAAHQVQAQQSERFHELLHQLRNPLTALRTFGKLLLKRLEPEDRNHGVAGSIVQESDRMGSLLRYFDDTLQATDAALATSTAPLPRLTAAPREGAAAPAFSPSEMAFGGTLALAPRDLSALVQPLITSAATLAESRNRPFMAVVQDTAVPVMVDANAFQEVITNLVENALKYGPSGTLVWLQTGLRQAEPNGTFAGILVGDTGPGIPLGDQAHIFDRHYRGVQAQGQIPGTGLGLAIVQDLVTRMGGRVEVYSPLASSPWHPPTEAPPHLESQGTVFVVWLLEAAIAPPTKNQ